MRNKEKVRLLSSIDEEVKARQEKDMEHTNFIKKRPKLSVYVHHNFDEPYGKFD